MIDSKHLKPNIPSSKFIEMPQEFGWALSSAFGVPTSGLTVSDRLPNGFECSEIKLTLTSGDTSGIVSVDIHKNGTSIFEVPVSIDVSGTTSVGATTPFLFTSSATTTTFLDNNEVKFYVSGATDCLGLKIKLIGNRII